jgi:hypothetical protein
VAEDRRGDDLELALLGSLDRRRHRVAVDVVAALAEEVQDANAGSMRMRRRLPTRGSRAGVVSAVRGVDVEAVAAHEPARNTLPRRRRRRPAPSAR